MVKLKSNPDVFNEFVDFPDEGPHERAIILRDKGEEILECFGLGLAESPSELLLEVFPAGPRGCQDAAMRIQSRAGVGERIEVAAAQASLLRLQQRKHLAVLL